jgi:predicted alpha/beta hydrolase
MHADDHLSIPAEITSAPFTLVAGDGYPLAANWFLPEREPARGTLIIHGATATPAAFYRRFARFAASRGLRVLTYDYRGIGLSRPASLRDSRATLSDWALLDARAAHLHVRERFPDEPVAIVGHSFGGQLVGLLGETRSAHAALMVGCQLAYYGNWPTRSARLLLATGWRAVLPLVTALVGYLPGRFVGSGEDLPAGVARQWGRWCCHPDYYMGEHPDARARLAAFDAPTLFYSFTDDTFAPGRAVAQLLSHLPKAQLEHRRIDPRTLGAGPIGHFGFFRAGTASLWPAALDFVLGRLANERRTSEASGRFRIMDEVMADLQYGRS